jgi:hypothetical protein
MILRINLLTSFHSKIAFHELNVRINERWIFFHADLFIIIAIVVIMESQGFFLTTIAHHYILHCLLSS